MRTKPEVEKEVRTLTEMKPKVPHHSMFGDDNHEAIDAQISVLTHQQSEDDIYTLYEEDGTSHVLDSALDAYRWLKGEEDTAPSADWKGLIK